MNYAKRAMFACRPVFAKLDKKEDPNEQPLSEEETVDDEETTPIVEILTVIPILVPAGERAYEGEGRCEWRQRKDRPHVQWDTNTKIKKRDLIFPP